MRDKQFVASMCISAAMVLLPAAASAATLRECVPGKVTAASHTWNFKQEADGLFKEVRADAWRARRHAEHLVNFRADSDLDFQAYGDQLSRVKSAINDMSGPVCRLESIRSALAPWQQRSVDRIQAAVTLMTDNTQDAMTFINRHQNMLWSPALEDNLENLRNQAEGLTRSTGHAVELAKAGAEHRALSGELSAKASS